MHSILNHGIQFLGQNRNSLITDSIYYSVFRLNTGAPYLFFFSIDKPFSLKDAIKTILEYCWKIRLVHIQVVQMYMYQAWDVENPPLTGNLEAEMSKIFP